MMRSIVAIAALSLSLPSPVRAALDVQKPEVHAVPVPMPGGGAGIGFDDLGFAPGLKKVLVPGGRTGKLFLVDPKTKKISSVGGFSESKDYQGGHGEGVTTADEGRGLLFGADRGAVAVVAVDPKSKRTLARAKLGGAPDYVRYVAATGEVWVSEPDSERIEIFSADGLKHLGSIAVAGGPESLVIDDARRRAYTHTWKDESVSIDLDKRSIAARWRNGCAGSRGIALDEKRGFLFVGCDEGKAVVLDAARGGKVLSTLSAGDGVDVIAYDPALGHLYLPGSKSATLAVLRVADGGALTLLSTLPTAKGAHCAAADGSGGVWACDPERGRLLYFKDED